MKPFRNILYLLACAGIILVVLIVASLFDIVLVFFNQRFYSNGVFITVFGVAGVFAAVLGYMQGIAMAPQKNEKARWSLILLLLLSGLLFFFVFAKLEGGEYGAAFKAYGITLGLTSFLFVKGKPDV